MVLNNTLVDEFQIHPNSKTELGAKVHMAKDDKIIKKKN